MKMIADAEWKQHLMESCQQFSFVLLLPMAAGSYSRLAEEPLKR